jgi:hypothetical protein
MQPEWCRDGKELFYLSRDGKIMAVPIPAGDKTIGAGTARPLFGVDVVAPISPYPNDYGLPQLAGRVEQVALTRCNLAGLASVQVWRCAAIRSTRAIF